MTLKYLSILPLILCMGLASAAEITIPQVLSESVAQRLLANDPALAAADGSLSSAQIEANQQSLSPYDWVARGTYQRRDYRGNNADNGANSNEWNFGIERTIRLPAKLRADEASAKAANQIAPLQYQQTRRQVVAGMLDTWFDWLTADASKNLLLRQQTAVADNVSVVTKRVKGGDAAQLEQKLASAELTTLQRQVSEASNAEASAWTLLMVRYQARPDVKPNNLPDPIAIPNDATWWQSRMLEANEPLALARSQVISAEAAAQRAKAENQPDPTLGVFTANEAYGNERIIGVTASIPIGGKRRSLEVERMLAQVNNSRLNLALVEREQRAVIQTSYHTAQGYFERWQLAQQAAITMADNARLTQKAYSLGEGDVQLLLLARRQALAAAEDEATAKIAALRSYYQLLLNAKLLWPGWLNRIAL
jgi:cobalt-zinc-cadmium efflux system outer membrane protein